MSVETDGCAQPGLQLSSSVSESHNKLGALFAVPACALGLHAVNERHTIEGRIGGCLHQWHCPTWVLKAGLFASL